MPVDQYAFGRQLFAKSKHHMTNWSAYAESLLGRGEITVWIDECVAHTGKQGGQFW